MLPNRAPVVRNRVPTPAALRARLRDRALVRVILRYGGHEYLRDSVQKKKSGLFLKYQKILKYKNLGREN